ncbi:hypothetical protein D2E80_19685 [Mycobacteroides abscessus]|nr:hypothetical protein D2E80_19685 [Mycobacteroides abscessus]
MLFHCGLDEVDIAVRRITDVRLDTPAEEVSILTTVPADSPLDDHAADHARIAKTLATEQCSFEVVVIAAAPFAGIAACFQQVLDAIEQFLVDKGSVASRVGLSLVLDQAQVVRVFQHRSDFRLRDRPGGPCLCSPGRQSIPIEVRDDVIDC